MQNKALVPVVELFTATRHHFAKCIMYQRLLPTLKESLPPVAAEPMVAIPSAVPIRQQVEITWASRHAEGKLGSHKLTTAHENERKDTEEATSRALRLLIKKT